MREDHSSWIDMGESNRHAMIKLSTLGIFVQILGMTAVSVVSSVVPQSMINHKNVYFITKRNRQYYYILYSWSVLGVRPKNNVKKLNISKQRDYPFMYSHNTRLANPL